MSFDEIVAPKIADNNPKGKHPGTGDKDSAMESMLYSHIKGENDRAHNNVQFRGLVLYKSLLSYEQFQKKYDPTFVEYCTKASPEFEGDLKDISSFNILEARVYIQELCSCLPQPENTERFFQNIKKATKMSKDLKNVRESLDNPTISLKDLIKLNIVFFKKDEIDTRIKHVYLNEKGKKIFEEIFILQKKRIYNALLNSSSEEVINFDNVLKKIING